MSDRIRILPDVVANQIAAGEVVNNPSSVVKEMMENAVDAGASRVTVNFRDGGKELIQVVDDGCGMSPIDARLAFDRHATSKIRHAEDIYNIATFGFRGEALASIAAVSEVEVRTRQRGEAVGTSVEIGGGTFRDQTCVNCPEGTQFLVKNLFYNIPARRRFIESTPKEARRIREEFRRVALCHPDVAFALWENDAPLYNLPATNLRQRIVGAIGKNIATNLLEVKADTSIVRIEGFVGRPAASKQNNAEQYLFVNGRYFKSAYFQKAIFAAYEKLIPTNTKPSYFVYLTLDPDRIDVNVHPQKTEVKFEDGPALWQILHAAVRASLGKLGALPMMDFDMDTSIEIPVHRSGAIFKSPEIKPNPEFNPFRDRVHDPAPRPAYGDYAPDVFEPREPSGEGDYVDYRSALGAAEEELAPEEDRSVIEFIEGDDAWQAALELDGQTVFGPVLPLGGRYCATTLGGELILVDVSRAHEAVLYDRYLRMLGAGSCAPQGLLFPQDVALSMEECAAARTHREELGRAGFEFTVPDEHTVALTSLPADFAGGDAQGLFRELLAALADETGQASGMHLTLLARTMARNGAARRTPDEAALAGLLAQLAACAQGNLTPAGLPVLLKITNEEIKRRF